MANELSDEKFDRLFRSIHEHFSYMTRSQLESLCAKIYTELNKTPMALEEFAEMEDREPDLDSLSFKRDLVVVQAGAEIMRRHGSPLGGGSLNPLKQRSAQEWFCELLDLGV